MYTKSFVLITLAFLFFNGTSLIIARDIGGGREGGRIEGGGGGERFGRPNEGMRSEYHPEGMGSEYHTQYHHDYGARAYEDRRAYNRGAENEGLYQGNYGDYGAYDYPADVETDGSNNGTEYNYNYEYNTVPQESQQQAQQFLND